MVANPIFLHAYFATIGLLEGHRPREILDHTKAQFHQAWGLALLVWTPVQLINFSIMPVHFQAAFVSLVNVGWKMTLSLVRCDLPVPAHTNARARHTNARWWAATLLPPHKGAHAPPPHTHT
jgi:hypothetical protein